ncbi:MAG: glycosyltransferase family 4 protein [Syntrophales bacterium LBB04]|nr:glycosyltransferase family 4 protein [Syntrophales bacterium LBB04]
MKVLHVINALHKGGAEVHLLLLAKGMQAMGVTCDVAFLRSKVAGGSVDMRDDFDKAGIRTHYLKCESSCDPRIGIRLNRLLRERKCDVLHSHLPRADAAAAFCKFMNPKQKWISTLHHPYDNAYSASFMIPALAPMWRRADGIIAVSEMVREWSIRRLGVLPDSVQTIEHGINIELHEDGNEPSLNAQSGRKRFCIGTIGRYEERKGHETLILAMPYILQEFPEAELKIAGPDPWGHGKILKKLIAEMRLANQVQLVGFVTDKHAFFSGIDVFALASLAEGFGIVVLEAMAEAKPVVISNISPLNNIITPGVSGLVAESGDPRGFADAVISLFRDEAYLHRMGAEGVKRVTGEFSTEKMVRKTLTYYETVLRK